MMNTPSKQKFVKTERVPGKNEKPRNHIKFKIIDPILLLLLSIINIEVQICSWFKLYFPVISLYHAYDKGKYNLNGGYI